MITASSFVPVQTKSAACFSNAREFAAATTTSVGGSDSAGAGAHIANARTAAAAAFTVVCFIITSLLLFAGKDEGGEDREEDRQGDNVDGDGAHNFAGLDAFIAGKPLERTERRDRVRRIGDRPRHH